MQTITFGTVYKLQVEITLDPEMATHMVRIAAYNILVLWEDI